MGFPLLFRLTDMFANFPSDAGQMLRGKVQRFLIGNGRKGIGPPI